MKTVTFKNPDQVIPYKGPTLNLIRELFSGLNTGRFSYCHWKSNEHLDASMNGDTDLDMLFDFTEKAHLEDFLHDTGFKKFISVKQKRYQDIEDYIGLDMQSGKIVHLHTHYRLTLGEPYLKGYQLNIERQILETRIFDSEFGIYRIEPSLELILLFFRQALKLRHRDKIKIILKRKKSVPGNLVREYNWIRSQVNPARIIEITSALFSESDKIAEVINGQFSQNQFYKLSLILKKELKNSRLFHPSKALVRRWLREAFLKTTRKLTRHIKMPIVQRRVYPGTGLAVAVIGADGSGKSTVIKNLNDTFSKKLDVYPIYFGKGGYVSWSNRILKILRKGKSASTSNKVPSVNTVKAEKKNGFIKNLLKCLDALEIVAVKNKNLKRMMIARSKGMMVICDRYPQNQVMGYNDGPQLNHLLNSENWLFRSIARREKQIFSKFDRNVPDIIFKLIADAAVIESRKPGQTPMHVLEDKIAAIRNQQFPENCSVLAIDASRPLDKVLGSIKKKIWEYYP